MKNYSFLIVLSFLFVAGLTAKEKNEAPAKGGSTDSKPSEAVNKNNAEAKKAPTKGKKKVNPKLLEKYDANNNGILDKEEEKKAQLDRDTREVNNWLRFDTDENGKIDEHERLMLIDKNKKMLERINMNPKNKMNLFKRYDTDKDGVLSIEEIEVGVNAISDQEIKRYERIFIKVKAAEAKHYDSSSTTKEDS